MFVFWKLFVGEESSEMENVVNRQKEFASSFKIVH